MRYKFDGYAQNWNCVLVLGRKESSSLIRGKYGLCILLVNWSPGIIALLHMVAYHRYLLAKDQLL